MPAEANKTGSRGGTEIFISYSRSDKATTMHLYKIFEEYGITAWYDAFIKPAENWREAIVEHLQHARIMLILLSAHSQQSDELKKELAVAKAAGVPLLAVRLEDVKLSGSFAYELAGLNWFDVFDMPEKRYIQLADFLAELVKAPMEDLKSVHISIEKFSTGSQKKLPLFKRVLYGSTTPIYTFLAVSGIQFLLYEILKSPLERLLDSGVNALTAYFYVTAAVTVGSPVLLLTVLKGGLTPYEFPLLLTSTTNTCLLIILISKACKRLYEKFLNLKNR